MTANNGYRPNFTGPFPRSLPARLEPSNPLSGSGSPESRLAGVPGQLYRDVDNDQMWMKMCGSNILGWELIGEYPYCTTAAEVDAGVFYGEGDPNGAVEAQRPAFYYTPNGGVWVKTNAALDTNGWSVLVSES